MQFQSTLPREERPVRQVLMYQTCYFNPRFHERSDVFQRAKRNSCRISIHASTRGATMRSSFPSSFISCISIHASTRGATKKRLKIACKGFNFNPRFHERSDINQLNADERASEISIHASTRGATYIRTAKQKEWIISIHASTRGATTRIALFEKAHAISIHASTRGATGFSMCRILLTIFQSTLPREERLKKGNLRTYWEYFNPRFHERSDR